MSATLAATVVMVRDVEPGDGPLEVLLVRRTSAVAFGGNWVFPGGRVEPSDAEPVAASGAGPSRPAAPARGAGPGGPAASGSSAGRPVAPEGAGTAASEELDISRRAAARELREESSLVVEPEQLVPLALWVPPAEAPRRYRTWFFVAAAPTAAVHVDGTEIVDHAWMAPAEALARHGAGTVELTPPTWMTLWRLAREWGSTVDEVLVALARRVPDRFQTRMVAHGVQVHAVWEGDAAYASGDLEAPGPRRRLTVGPLPWTVQWDPPGDGEPAIISA